jgi:tetratricopeptide (TPR) repeat protein
MISAPDDIEQGFQSLQRGDVAAAEQIADRVTQFDANFADGWFLRGLVHHLRGDAAAAIQLYERALALKPGYFGALNNLGVVYAGAGRHEDALATIAQYLRLDPENAVANCNYANSLAALGRQGEAAIHYRRALAQQPDYFDALTNSGTMLLGQNKPQEALPCFKRACELQPASFQAQNNLGLTYSNLQEHDAAHIHLSEAVRLNRESYEAWSNLGTHFAKIKNFDRAVACHRQAVQLRPGEATAHDNLGLALLESGQHLEALDCLHRALELQPNLATAHCSLGKALMELCRFSEAEAHLLEARRLRPEYAHPHNLLGMILFQRGEDDAALRSFDAALGHAPDLLYARLNRTFLLLRQGDFARGWPDYELRLTTDAAGALPCPAPRWDGSDLNGRTILVRAEQGRGDIFQFLRYLPVLRGKGARVVCELQTGMHPFAERMNACDILVEKGQPLPAVDVQIPMMSLPYALGSIDAPVPYLHADPRLVDAWAAELRRIEGFKIGVCWQGDRTCRFDAMRSFPLAEFEPLARIPGVRLVNMQKYDGVDQIAVHRERVPLIDFGARIDEAAGPFQDTAAIMMNLDLVITSDTSTAHLAGGLGVPTWLALPLGPDWRWFQGREDSPWYPSMRLFRQSRFGQWSDVFARLADAVRAEMARRESAERGAMPEDAGLGSTFYVPTSPGELLDKFSILQIKSERLTNRDQVYNVRTELRLLEKQRDRALAGADSLAEFERQLKEVNEALWQIEEDIRSCERDEDFGPRFIELARSVYKHNDHRAALKRQINLVLGSPLTEEKTHLLAAEM